MLNLTQVEIDAFVQHLQEGYRRTYGGHNPAFSEIVAWAGSMALENIATSDALYHNVDHTILVTLVGQELLRGKHIREGGVSSEDWLHVSVALLCHDIGYVKGVCQGDEPGRYVTGRDGQTVTLSRGATDAALTPYHVDRGKLFVHERFSRHSVIDVDRIQRYIEPTRFPVPQPEDEADLGGFPAIVRAADLIGQLSDPRYLKKIPALFFEFQETGINRNLGYQNPADLRENYPKFYWEKVFPYVKDALGYLSLTQAGQQIKASLYANVFVVEHEADGARAAARI